MNSQAIARGKGPNKRVQSRFQRLWAEAEAAAGDNEKLDIELDTLVQRVGIDVGKAESALADTLRKTVHRQLDFAEKKSLLKWQRAELSEWIDEYLNQLMELGQLDEALQNRLAVLRARELDLELDHDSTLSPVEQLRVYMDQLVAEELEQFNGVRLDEDWFDDDDEIPPSGANYEDDEEDLDELLKRLHEEFAKDNGVSPEPDVDTGKPGRILDDAVFKRLFRQTAAALHPDKETNPDRQREKHVLMSDLLRARKERDLIAVLHLHEKYASANSDLSTKDEQQLEEVLIAYLSQQRERMEDIVHRSPMHQWVFHEIYHKNPSTVKRRMNAYIKKIDMRRQGLEVFVTRIRTLKMLKELLVERYERHRFGVDWL
ncbi:MAG: hypothetical protein AB8B64_01030 [Granulosicoccus sp.]